MIIVLNMAVITTIMVACILLIKTIFKHKISAKAHYYIWLLLVVRLICIPIIPNFNVENTRIENNLRHIGNMQNITSNLNTNNIIINTKRVGKISVIKSNILINSKKFMMITWEIGSAIMIGYTIFMIGYFNIKLRRIPMCEVAEIKEILESCKRKVGIKRTVKIKQYDGNSMVAGILSPTVLIGESYNKQELEQVLIHELYHLKNRDTLTNLFALIFLSINWYNPIVWLGFFTFKKDTEILCDERVINLIKNKKEYATLLIKSINNNYNLNAIGLYIQSGRKEIKERIIFMSESKKNKKIYRVVVLSAILISSSGSMIVPKVQAAGTERATSIVAKDNKLSGEGDYYNIVNDFTSSIKFNNKNQTLSFTVPKTKPEGYKWFVHIDGHEQRKDGPTVFHIFEDESYNYKWKDGESYSYTFKDYPLIQSSFEVGLIKKDNSGGIKGDTIVSIDKEGKIVQNKAVVSDAVYGLIDTIEYNSQNKNIRFTLPEKIPQDYKWFIHIDGHEQRKDGPVVFHAFEDETYNYKWQNGKTYNYDFKENTMVGTSFDIGLMNIKTQEIENEITVVLNSDGTLTY